MNTTLRKWHRALLIVSGIAGVGIVGLILYTLTAPSPDNGLLGAPILRDDPNNPQTALPADKFNPGEFTGYRLMISFPGNKLNPYPYGVSKGKVEVLDTNSQVVAVNGAIAIDQSVNKTDRNLIPDEGDFSNPYSPFFRSQASKYIPEARSVVGGYVAGKKPVPLRYGDVVRASGSGEGSSVIEIRNGIAEFSYLNDGYLSGHRTFNVTGFEIKDDETGKFTLLPPPTLLDNLLYPQTGRGSSVTSQQSFMMGDFNGSEHPQLFPEHTTTGGHYYTITSDADSISRDPEEDQSIITLDIKPVELNGSSESVTKRYTAKLTLMPAYPEPAVLHSTYAAQFESVTVDGKTTDATKSVGDVGFEIGSDGAKVVLKTNNEPSLLGYLGFFLEVSESNRGNAATNILRSDTFVAKTTHLIPMTTQKTGNRFSIPPLLLDFLLFHLAVLSLGSLLSVLYTKRTRTT